LLYDDGGKRVARYDKMHVFKFDGGDKEQYDESRTVEPGTQPVAVDSPFGRLALSVWGDPEANRWASVPARVLAEHTGAPPPEPLAPGIFAMASEGRIRELLGEAGFEPRRVEHVDLEWAFEKPDDYWHYVMDHAGALAMKIRSLPESDQAAIRMLSGRNPSHIRIETNDQQSPNRPIPAGIAKSGTIKPFAGLHSIVAISPAASATLTPSAPTVNVASSLGNPQISRPPSSDAWLSTHNFSTKTPICRP